LLRHGLALVAEAAETDTGKELSCSLLAGLAE
jgi:hypothetical protein